MLVAVIAAVVLGQPEQVLRGPEIRARGSGALVEVDMSGRVKRPEKTIEQEAVAKLDLAAEVRDRVDRILVERAAAIDRFVTENLLLLNQAQTVGAAGTLMEKLTLVGEGLKRIEPAVGGMTLRERIAAALPEEEAQKFKSMLKDYWKALAVEAANLKPKDPPPPWAVYLGESLASLGREIGKSFERQLSSGTLFVDYLIADLGLTEKQQEMFRTMKLEVLEATNMKPSEEDQKKLVIGVVAYLKQEQREKVMKRVGGVK